ncbi:MAG: universal stress protein [Usitatibacter sp.]
MLKLLIATDGSENARRAVQHVVALARRGIAIEAVLCNVQPPVMSGEVGAIAPMEIAECRRTLAAAAAFAAATGPLEDAGVRVGVHEATGNAAEEIAAAADALKCDAIVMGRRGLGSLASLVMGSVSSQVVRRAGVPVTLVN